MQRCLIITCLWLADVTCGERGEHLYYFWRESTSTYVLFQRIIIIVPFSNSCSLHSWESALWLVELVTCPLGLQAGCIPARLVCRFTN